MSALVPIEKAVCIGEVLRARRGADQKGERYGSVDAHCVSRKSGGGIKPSGNRKVKKGIRWITEEGKVQLAVGKVLEVVLAKAKGLASVVTGSKDGSPGKLLVIRYHKACISTEDRGGKSSAL